MLEAWSCPHCPAVQESCSTGLRGLCRNSQVHRTRLLKPWESTLLIICFAQWSRSALQGHIWYSWSWMTGASQDATGGGRDDCPQLPPVVLGGSSELQAGTTRSRCQPCRCHGVGHVRVTTARRSWWWLQQRQISGGICAPRPWSSPTHHLCSRFASFGDIYFDPWDTAQRDRGLTSLSSFGRKTVVHS